MSDTASIRTTLPAPRQIPVYAIDCAEHHTEERRRWIDEVASGRFTLWHFGEGPRWLAGNKQAQDAYRRLLLHVDRFIDALRGKRLYRGAPYPSICQALAVLAFHHERWIRPIEEWSVPVHRNGRPERRHLFRSLLHHLLARYEVPDFMDRVWFEGVSERALQMQEWYIHLALGGSVSDLDLPVHLTKRMAHLFRNAPRNGTVTHNLRWAQVIGMGGSMTLAEAVTQTRLGRYCDHDAFWSTVIQFLVNNAMVDPTWAGPIVDYIHNMKFAPRQEVQEGGGVMEGPPPHPNFAMKGRSAMKLLREIETWHEQLGREEDVVYESWQTCGARPWEVEEDVPPLGTVRWSVQELRSSYELAAHGREMNHCVVSYSSRCADGHAAIWAIYARREGQDEREGILTVALDVETRTVTQARGRYNMDPARPTRITRRKKDETPGYVELLMQADSVLNRWVQRERLARDR